MKAEIESSIKYLAEQSKKDNVRADDALKFSQAALNLAHVLQVQSAITVAENSRQ